jgi:hypothetical protein
MEEMLGMSLPDLSLKITRTVNRFCTSAKLIQPRRKQREEGIMVPNQSVSVCGVLERNVRKQDEGGTIDGMKDERSRDARGMNVKKKRNVVRQSNIRK